MSMNIWDTENDEALVQRCEHHTEFVVGLDFNIFIEGQVMSMCCHTRLSGRAVGGGLLVGRIYLHMATRLTTLDSVKRQLPRLIA